METVDRQPIRASVARVWPIAVGVEQWPGILPHYRWVTRLEGAAGADGVVEMAAWRPFGWARWPTWWRSAIAVDAPRHTIRYRHIAGLTRGMEVEWTLRPMAGDRCEACIVHRWDGPPWSVLRRPAAEWVIGPVFVHGIAQRTLAGIARASEEK